MKIKLESPSQIKIKLELEQYDAQTLVRLLKCVKPDMDIDVEIMRDDLLKELEKKV